MPTVTAASVEPSCPCCAPGLRPLLFRSDRRGAGLPSPSLDGGLDEFRGVCVSRASSSAIRSRATASSPGRPRQRGLRPGQFRAQRGHQRSQHLTSGTSIIARHTATLFPPGITQRRSRYPAGGRELLNSGDDAKRVPRGVGVDPQRLLRVIRAVIQQLGAERERPLMRDVKVSLGGTVVSRCNCCGTGPSGQVAPGSSPTFWNASTAPPAGLVNISQSCPFGSGWPGAGGSSPGWYRRPNSCR